MPLLNYTTEIDSAKTVGQVQAILAKAGARSITAEFDGKGRATGLSFAAEVPGGIEFFTLPVHPDRVLTVLRKQRVQARYQTFEQAERVAWRIVKDWVEAQLAIIETEMVSLVEVMLPYMRVEGGSTVFEKFLDTRKQLGAGRGGADRG